MEVFVARQPILDRYRHVYAHELLFRSGLTNAFPSTEPDHASTNAEVCMDAVAWSTGNFPGASHDRLAATAVVVDKPLPSRHHHANTRPPRHCGFSEY